ncbi:MAG: TIGR03560 family F420-dependent LLM class oxidoreductase [Anaerolineales bacterium]|nr:TIGR03560 family F420-dependent LLM class oxidoreductase [Anaerolineales bacterium]
MEFGYHHAYFDQDAEAETVYARVVERALWAEKHGFSLFTVMDHLIQIGGLGPQHWPVMEPWTLLGALAAETSRIRLGTLATSVGYRNPALLAKMAAGVDIISGGRLVLGIGAGWFEEEYRQYGYPYEPKASVRIEQLEEAVEMIKLLWRGPRATYTGRYFQVEDAILEPKPIQKPHPTIMIAGSGKKYTLGVVARQADMSNVFGSPESIRPKYEALRRHCDENGRDFNEVTRSNLTELLLAKSDSELAEKKARYGIPDDYWGHTLTVAEAIDLLGRYAQVGVQVFIFSLHQHDPEGMALFTEEVMPAFRSAV